MGCLGPHGPAWTRAGRPRARRVRLLAGAGASRPLASWRGGALAGRARRAERIGVWWVRVWSGFWAGLSSG
jgi:hypothetical protein